MISFGEFLVQLSQDNKHSQQLNSLQNMKIDLGDSLRMSLWSEGRSPSTTNSEGGFAFRNKGRV